MVTVRELLQVNGGRVWSVSPDETVFNAIRLMSDRSIGAVLVMQDERLAGIMSERDYTRKVALRDRSSKSTRVSEIMTTQVVCVTASQTVDDCMQLMSERHIRHLPVVEQGAVLGVVSILDVLRSMLHDREFEIRQLENYIAGTA